MAVYRLIGWTMLVVMMCAALLFAVKLFYLLLLGEIAFSTLPGAAPLRLIDPQANPVRHFLNAHPMLSFLWDLVPTGDNWFLLWMYMVFTAWGFIGRKLVNYANRLNGRIRRARETIEEMKWRRDLGEIQQNVGVLSLQLESEERWYEKPSGLLLLGLIVTIVGGIAVVVAEQMLYPR